MAEARHKTPTVAFDNTTGHFLPVPLIQCKPELCNKRGAAPVRHQTLRVCHRINGAAWQRMGIASQDKTVFLGEVGVVVTQIEIENFASERYARLPIKISRQRKAA